VLVKVTFVEAGDVEVIEVELLLVEDAKDVLVKVAFVEAGDDEAGDDEAGDDEADGK